jgi:adenylate kinase
MDKKRLAIIVLGAPGAGKGTQARLIGEELRYPHISTGDMLRESVRDKTELGKKARAFMESGSLVPDELVDAIVAERLGREDSRRGFILDGYPRTISQAESLKSLFVKDGTEVLALGIEVGDDLLVRRLSSRWTCPKCGKMFNAQLDPAKIKGNCDECGTALVQRKDDTPEVIAERLQVYHKTTRPLIRYYQEQSAYKEISGEKPVQEVFDTIIGIVKSRTD